MAHPTKDPPAIEDLHELPALSSPSKPPSNDMFPAHTRLLKPPVHHAIPTSTLSPGALSFRQVVKPIALSKRLTKKHLTNPLINLPYSTYDGPPNDSSCARHDINLLQNLLIATLSGTTDQSHPSFQSLLHTGLDLETWKLTLTKALKSTSIPGITHFYKAMAVVRLQTGPHTS